MLPAVLNNKMSRNRGALIYVLSAKIDLRLSACQLEPLRYRSIDVCQYDEVIYDAVILRLRQSKFDVYYLMVLFHTNTGSLYVGSVRSI